MKWIDAMNDYGSDKPDTRFGMKLVEVTDLVKDCGFSVFADAASKKGWSVRGINAKGQGGMGRKQIDKIVEMARGNGAKGPSLYPAQRRTGPSSAPLQNLSPRRRFRRWSAAWAVRQATFSSSLRTKTVSSGTSWVLCA